MAFTDEPEQAEEQLRVLESLGRPLDSALTRDSAVPVGDLSAYVAMTVTPGGAWFDPRWGQELWVMSERKSCPDNRTNKEGSLGLWRLSAGLKQVPD